MEALQWVIFIGCYDIGKEVMTLSSFFVAPWEGHLSWAKRIVGYLCKIHDRKIWFYTKISESNNTEPWLGADNIWECTWTTTSGCTTTPRSWNCYHYVHWSKPLPQYNHWKVSYGGPPPTQPHSHWLLHQEVICSRDHHICFWVHGNLHGNRKNNGRYNSMEPEFCTA